MRQSDTRSCPVPAVCDTTTTRSIVGQHAPTTTRDVAGTPNVECTEKNLFESRPMATQITVIEHLTSCFILSLYTPRSYLLLSHYLIAPPPDTDQILTTTMARGDFVMTIDSDDDETVRGDDDGPALDPGFSFDVTGGALTGVLDVWDASADIVKSGSKPVGRTWFSSPRRADLLSSTGAYFCRRHY